MQVTSPGAECIFCDIVNGRATASRVYEDDRILAFLDVHPINPGHALVIPKKHITYLDDLEPDVGAAVFRVAHMMAMSLRRSGLRCEGVNLFLADGAAAFQEVFHTHLHVFPRFVGDGFSINADWQRRTAGELDTVAIQVRKGMHALGRAQQS